MRSKSEPSTGTRGSWQGYKFPRSRCWKKIRWTERRTEVSNAYGPHIRNIGDAVCMGWMPCTQQHNL